MYCSIYKKYHINFISFTYEIWIYNHIESLKLKKKKIIFSIYIATVIITTFLKRLSPFRKKSEREAQRSACFRVRLPSELGREIFSSVFARRNLDLGKLTISFLTSCSCFSLTMSTLGEIVM